VSHPARRDPPTLRDTNSAKDRAAAMGGRLTVAQQRLLAPGLLEPASSLEVLQLAVVLPTDTDIEALGGAWGSVCSQEPIFRRSLSESGTTIAAEPPLAYSTSDHAPDVETAIDEALTRDRSNALDVSEQVHRLTWSTGPSPHGILIWSVHHAVVDLASLVLVATEAFRRFAGHPRRVPSGHEYERALVRTQQGGTGASETAWRGRRIPESYIVPSPRGRQGSTGWTQRVGPDPRRIRASTRFLAATIVAASEVVGEPSVEVGMVYSTRRYLDHSQRHVIGPCISVVPVAAEVDRSSSVDGFLLEVARAQATARDLAAHDVPDWAAQDWPLVLNYQPLDWRRSISNAVVDALRRRGHTVSTDATRVALARNSSMRAVLDVDHPLGVSDAVCSLDAWDGSYDAVARRRLATRIGRLFARLDESCFATLSDVVTPEGRDRKRVLRSGTGRRTPPDNAGVLDIIKEIVARTPGALALEDGRQALTYGELLDRARQGAHTLTSNGVRPAERVGLSLPRNADALLAVLAVLAAGATYVPLDPSYPPERTAHAARDGGVTTVVSADGCESPLPGVRHVSLGGPSIAAESLVAAPSGQGIAYVLHTSGSSGRPKGVAVSHRSVANLARAQVEAFGLRSYDRVLQFASLGFDASVSEMFATWAAGASLHVVPDDARLGQQLADFLVGKRITFCTLPPSVLAGLPTEPSYRLRTIVTAGEPCPDALVMRWADRVLLLNAYGPTEATVCATVGQLAPRQPPALGRPLDNVSIRVLDETGALAAPGAQGELFIGGAGVCAGYLRNGEPSVDEQIRDPFSPGAHPRLHATGDLVRLLSDLSVVYRGRRDAQEKLNGIRVDLDEVGNAVAAHPDVVQAVAVVQRTNEPASSRLVAHVVSRTGQVPVDLRERVSRSLPAHSVPHAFSLLDRVPLTPSGKVDLRALPAVTVVVHPRRHSYLAPTNDLEASLCRIWQEVLDVERVGVTDDFIELGGSSFQAARIASKARDLGDLQGPLRARTVRAQASSISASGPAPFPIAPSPRRARPTPTGSGS
jgi:amino acid adenylation domain-containing protein